MSSLSDHAEQLVLNWLFTTETATRPAGRFMELYTAAPNDAGGGTVVSGGGYVRKAIAFTAAASPGGTTANSGAVVFTASGGSWGTVTHMAIFDAVSGGNLLAHGALVSSRTIDDTDTLTFAIGTVNITMT